MQSSDSLYMKQPSDRLDKIHAILMGLKYSIDFTVAFFKSQYFYSYKNCHSLSGVSEKVHITNTEN